MHTFSVNTRFISNNKINKTIILNRKNGIWIKVPTVWMNVLSQYISDKCKMEDFVEKFEDDENRKSFLYFFQKAYDYEFIVDDDKKEDERIDLIQFAITERCNLSCVHCCFDAVTPVENSDLSFEDICKILDKMFSCSPKKITISGGEPMIRKDFYEIIDYIKKNFIGELSLSTNATLIKESDIPKLTCCAR